MNIKINLIKKIKNYIKSKQNLYATTKDFLRIKRTISRPGIFAKG